MLILFNNQLTIRPFGANIDAQNIWPAKLGLLDCAYTGSKRRRYKRR